MSAATRRVPTEVQREATAAWDAAVARMPATAQNIWLRPLRVVALRGGKLVVSGPPRHMSWAKRRYARALSHIVSEDSRFDGVVFRG